MSELQDLVDGLAEALRRPVAVEDRRLRVLAYSAHLTGADRVRLASILTREAPADVVAWMERAGVHRAEGTLRLAADETLGMEPRVCVPVRRAGALLGFVWLIDDPPLDAAELAAATAAAATAAGVLARLRERDEAERERDSARVAALVGAAPAERAAAAAGLLGPVAVLVIRPAGENALAALERARRAAGLSRDRLLLRLAGERVIAVAAAEDSALERLGRETGKGIARADAALSRGVGEAPFLGDSASDARPAADEPAADVASLAVGMSDVRARATELHAALREADAAAIVAERGTRPAPLRWRDLGSYQLLAALADVAAPVALERLLAHPDAGILVPTLETYLDHAGDAQATAATLHIHRTTLYHRLRRIEDASGRDLRSGDDRLLLHAALRLYRLASPS